MTLSRRSVLTGAIAAVPAALLAIGPADAVLSRPGPDGLASTGRQVIRDIQRQLLARYGQRVGFPPIADDGVWMGDSQRALIHGLQLEIGMPDDVANGSFGPATRAAFQAAVPELAVGARDSTGFTVHLLQSALAAMTTWDGPVDGVFSSAQATRLAMFQRSAALPETGRADYATWASLLTTNGDPTRPGTATDNVDVVTPARAATLTAAGYTIVGRYLTDSDVPDALKKQIVDGELATILGAGLRVVPIFQEGGTGSTYFSYDLGVRAAGRADDAAQRHGFLVGTTIYFAVDFDASPFHVERSVVPYFRGIQHALTRRGSGYRVGVYGSRAVCTAVSNARLAELSYLADMSTAWIGNCGVRMPRNWAFDQILEHTIGEGDGAIDIDTNIVSGRDRGQARLATRS